jgi:hypothetical protein
MKNYILALVGVIAFLAAAMPAKSQSNLKIVIIRHAEKQEKLENLSCMGFNRSLKLVNVLYKKIGVPDYVYVPAIGNGSTTSHSRMFQTITPFVVKYNLSINSAFKGSDFKNIVQDLDGKKGTVLFVWDHDNIQKLAKALGAKAKKLDWNDSDYDSMWVISGKGKNKVLTITKEGIVPAANCPVF